MTCVITVESTPPERSVPTGTSDINWRFTAARSPTPIASSHSRDVDGNDAGWNAASNRSKVGDVGSEPSLSRHKWPGGTFHAFR